MIKTRICEVILAMVREYCNNGRQIDINKEKI